MAEWASSCLCETGFYLALTLLRDAVARLLALAEGSCVSQVDSQGALVFVLALIKDRR
jgi:hypothetical protein